MLNKKRRFTLNHAYQNTNIYLFRRLPTYSLTYFINTKSSELEQMNEVLRATLYVTPQQAIW